MSAQSVSRTDVDLPPETNGRPAPADLVARRVGLAAAVASDIWRTEPESVQEVIGGVRCLRFVPPRRVAARGTLLHLHGGAFRLGCPEQLGPFAAALAARSRVDVVCPAYRLAPEHPFPAGLRDARAVFCALAAEERLIIVSGDSAGGGLAAGVVAMALGDTVQPVGLILLSAWLDLRVSSGSFETNAETDPLFSFASAREAAELYLQGTAADHPLASPLFGDLSSFPATFINVGAGEVLIDDARAFHIRLHEAGVPVDLEIISGMDHVAVTRGFDLSGAARTFESIVKFVDSRLD